MTRTPRKQDPVCCSPGRGLGCGSCGALRQHVREPWGALTTLRPLARNPPPPSQETHPKAPDVTCSVRAGAANCTSSNTSSSLSSFTLASRTCHLNRFSCIWWWRCVSSTQVHAGRVATVTGMAHCTIVSATF